MSMSKLFDEHIEMDRPMCCGVFLTEDGDGD